MNILNLPTMKQINQIPYNGHNVISLFAGAGGSSLGYRMAGFKVLLANEFIPEAQKVYKENHPDTILIPKDIRELSVAEILSITGLQPGELDILDGSPPCAQFSTINNKNKTKFGDVINYSGVGQRVDDLFFEYVRVLRGLMPKVFVAENVRGLRVGKAKEIYEQVLQEFRDSGYTVDCQLLNAADYGVPQNRRRLIFIGVRDDIGLLPSYPAPLPRKYTAKEVLPHLLRAFEDTHGQWSYGDFLDEQCPTITTKAAHLYAVDINNPNQHRTMTADEIKTLSSFPIDFTFAGLPKGKSIERVGRAVPPLMMYHIANHALTNILKKLPKEVE